MTVMEWFSELEKNNKNGIDLYAETWSKKCPLT